MQTPLPERNTLMNTVIHIIKDDEDMFLSLQGTQGWQNIGVWFR